VAGGYTKNQLFAMYHQHLKTKAEDFEFYAMCHGAKPASKKAQQSVPSELTIEKDDVLFDDPENYSKLSQQEREERTKTMMSHFKSMFGQTHITPSGGVGKVQMW
jgi:hypothetical protein